ncbi:MAG: polynucleotide adenylyltransferase PcnB [Spirochaetales bacterium]|nr:polynucleotide adenylyltransferase PcnB [Spirochaetales bacterium]
MKRLPLLKNRALQQSEGKRYYRQQHGLRREQMDPDALKVVNRLSRHGYKSYFVGGCVRDMLMGRKPKDFDIVTNATPAQIRKLFSNSRSIGRRFRIVHILFRGKVIEVSTFRSPSRRAGARDDDTEGELHYGTPQEDASRRDFTFNALYFDPRNESVIDYVGGYEDIRNKRIVIIGDADRSFREDPVRMLRAAKFSGLLGFELPSSLLKAIRRNKQEILKANQSRLLEEYTKIFRTGQTTEVFHKLADTGLLRILFGDAFDAGDAGRVPFPESGIGKRLAIADRMLNEREDLTATIYMSLIMADLVSSILDDRVKHNVIEHIKKKLMPAWKAIQYPARERDRMLQIFASQSRFNQSDNRKSRPDVFRKKPFFYEAFMVFKINALARGNEALVQKAMFWEIGPKTRPPEANRIISIFNRASYERSLQRALADDSMDRLGDGGPDKFSRGQDRGPRERGDRGERSDRTDRTERTERSARRPDRETPREGEPREGRRRRRDGRRRRRPGSANVTEKQPESVDQG